jgi:hypothetical protein
MDTVDMAIHPVVCQKSDFHGNSDFQNSQIPAKKFQAKIYRLFVDILVHYNSKIRY